MDHSPLRAWRLLIPLALLAVSACAQQQSPLKGQGLPGNETTEIFFSAYLNRLLEVDDRQYLHQNVVYFYISWWDPTAQDTIKKSTNKMLNGTNCGKPCTNLVDNVLCCDDLWLPSFTFRNAYAFPEDRLEDYRIYATDWGAVVWSAMVHGVYYQPMDFSHFPFDSFDLLIELEFYSTSDYSDLVRNYSHPGINMTVSSWGDKLYSIGKGDDSAQWKINDFSVFAANNLDAGEFFSAFSTVSSDINDPAPLSPTEGAGLCADGSSDCNIFTGVQQQWLGVYITVERFWRYQLLNSVLPVVLCALLGFIIFFLEMSELASRLEIIATLFLALTAVQFVLIDNTPASSYVIPTQQLVIATYVLLTVLALESVAVAHIATWPQRWEAAKRRREGHVRAKEARSPQSTYGRREAPRTPNSPPVLFGDDEEGGGMDSKTPIAMNGAAHEERPGCGSRLQRLFCCFKGGRQADAKLLKRASSSSVKKQLAKDEAYAEYLGYTLDIVFGCFLLVGYIIAAVLIFVLQDGYIDLFVET